MFQHAYLSHCQSLNFTPPQSPTKARFGILQTYCYLAPSINLEATRQLNSIIFAVGCSDETFIKSGFRNWKHASGKTGKLAKHAKSRMHLLSLERMQNFKTATPVDIQLNEAAREMRERQERERSENRRIVEVIFDVVRHLAKQNVAFRGHDETSLSKNKGNFLEEICFLAKYHQPLKDWIEKHPQNVSYLSHISQNEMLDICSNLITNAICEQIHTSNLLFN